MMLGRQASAGARNQGWRAVSSVAESVLFPDERHGSDYGANWAAASLGVTVGSKHAFRNAELKTVCAHSGKGALDKKTRALKHDVDAKQALFSKVDKDTFDDIISAACTSASAGSNALFIVDASAGGARAASANVRAVSDDSVTSRLLQAILCGAPKREAGQFQPKVQVVHSATPDSAAGSAYCAVFGSRVAARGKVGAATLSDAIATASSSALQGSALVLKGKAQIGKDGSVQLVLGSSKASSEDAITRHVVWSKDGVSRLWNSAQGPTESAGAVVEGGVAISPNGYKLANVLAHPSSVVFATGSAGSLDTEGAKKALASVSLVGGSEAEVALLEQLLKASGAKVSTI